MDEGPEETAALEELAEEAGFEAGVEAGVEAEVEAEVEAQIAQVAELVTRSGVVAALERLPEGDTIAVRDARGRLLFELKEGGRGVILSVAEGDLELRAEKGQVRISGERGVAIEGETLTLRAKRLRQIAGVIETRTRRILERAKDVYREVEGLSQLRAKDVRVVAKETVRMLGERLRMKSKKDVKVQGDKIYLG